MTTKEYIVKYRLDISDKFNHSDFVRDLAGDFIALLELNKANDNIKGFDNAVRCIRMKFDAISNKTLGVLPNKLWNYFFATVIAKLRDELCPRDMAKRREANEQKKKEWEERKKFKQWEQEQFNDFFWGRNFFAYLFAEQLVQKPVACFDTLGLSADANESDVTKAYKQLALIHHPDKGGKQDKFVEIVRCKNECLNWLKTRSNN